MKLYKLTTQEMKTHGGFTYTLNKQLHAAERGTELCTGQVLHAYIDPILGLLLNPIHASFEQPRLFEAEGVIVSKDYGKVGVKALMLTKEIVVPEITAEMRVEFAIRCALVCYKDGAFVKWTKAWLSGRDRSARAAEAVEAGRAAARAAEAVEAVEAVEAGRAAAWAAARAAAWAAAWAAWAAEAFDPIQILTSCSFYRSVLKQVRPL